MRYLQPLTLHHSPNSYSVSGAAVAEQLYCSPPTEAHQVQSPAESLPHFRMWESCRTMPLVSWSSWGSPVSSALAFWRCSILTSFHPHRSMDCNEQATCVGISRARPDFRECLFSLLAVSEEQARRVGGKEPWDKSRSRDAGRGIKAGLTRSVLQRILLSQRRQASDKGLFLTNTPLSCPTHNQTCRAASFRSVRRGFVFPHLCNMWRDLPMRGSEVSMEQRRNARAGETGDPTCENSGVARPGIKPGSPWWEASIIIAQQLQLVLLGEGAEEEGTSQTENSRNMRTRRKEWKNNERIAKKDTKIECDVRRLEVVMVAR
ncbi:hypothetical protein PR048_030956 [Dryococelus australis]|uniref:Uncharacterized protein n=1 Tax=Dryococelus australis TaxID=614101 RepID=A0ABQ9GAB9_9NEOP|nr:hypothetical protein PR048_030956 [Dryococelus australis]